MRVSDSSAARLKSKSQSKVPASVRMHPMSLVGGHSPISFNLLTIELQRLSQPMEVELIEISFHSPPTLSIFALKLSLICSSVTVSELTPPAKTLHAVCTIASSHRGGFSSRSCESLTANSGFKHKEDQRTASK